jgi:hypothetical protein
MRNFYPLINVVHERRLTQALRAEPNAGASRRAERRRFAPCRTPALCVKTNAGASCRDERWRFAPNQNTRSI